jgi:hypothetical protein
VVHIVIDPMRETHLALLNIIHIVPPGQRLSRNIYQYLSNSRRS